MPADTLFSLANPVAMIGWLILILAPRRWPLLNHIPRTAIPLALSVLYTALVLAFFGQATGGGYGSIAEVRALFAHDHVLVAGWVHYLAFDLMIGALLAERMDRAGINRLLQAPTLLATFLFGPMGVLLALITEATARLFTPKSPLTESQA